MLSGATYLNIPGGSVDGLPIQGTISTLPPTPSLNTSSGSGFWGNLSNLLNTTFPTIVQVLKSPTGVPFSQYVAAGAVPATGGAGATAYGLTGTASPLISPNVGSWLLIAGVVVIGAGLAVALFRK